MKKFGLMICMLLVGLIANSQELKKVIRKTGKKEKEEYYVLRSDKTIKEGHYQKYLTSRASKYKFIIEEGTYKAGVKVGIWQYLETEDKEYYNESGILIWKQESKNGKIIKNTYDENGKITQTLVNYKGDIKINDTTTMVVFNNNFYGFKGLKVNGEKEGNWSYDYLSQKSASVNYSNGKKVGCACSLFLSGDTSSKQFYVDGTLQSQTLFYQNGDTVCYHFKKDSLEYFYHYFLNGQLHQSAIFNNGKLERLSTLDSAGDAMTFGQVEKFNGDFAIYDLDSFFVKENCDIKNGCFDGKKGIIHFYKNGMQYNSRNEVTDSSYIMSSDDFISWRENGKEGHFIGGEKKLGEFVIDYFKTPLIAMDSQVSVTIYATFIVEIDGRIDTARPFYAKGDSSLGYGLEEEFIRVLKLTSGKWLPAFRNGIPVRSYYRYPLNLDYSEGF